MQGKYMCVRNGVSFIKKMKIVSFVEKMNRRKIITLSEISPTHKEM